MKKKLIIVFICFTSFFVLADRYSSLETFAQVLNIIKVNYFKDVKLDQLVHGAIKGLLREIDPHSQFFSSQKFKNFKDHSDGRFYGVGIEVEKKQGHIIIISILKNSSAERVGLKQGDKIIKMNKQIVQDLTLGEFSEIFSKNEKKYQMTILREKQRKPLSFTLKSSRIKIPSIKFKKLEEGFYYLRIHYFSKRTLLEMNKKLKNLSIKGLLLDVRSNPGGSLDQAIKVADLFLDKGIIVHYEMKQASKKETVKARASGTLDFFPMVILMDEYSASASEVLSGALKDNKRALLVGRKSFGKGSIQTLFPIKNKYVLKLTVGEYKTPSKLSIHNRGIKPHIQIPKSKDTFKTILEDSDILQAFKYLKNFKKYKL